MAFNINAFQGAMKFGGARPSLFQVNITNPVNGASDIQVPFMVRAAQIPGSTLGVVPLRYFGREVKFAGNRTFEPWTVTIFNDEDFAIRNAMEEWSNAISSHEENLRELGSASPVLYKSNAQVTQFSKTGVPVRVYDFVGLFPSEISPIEVDWESEGIETYTATFQYDYWRVSGGITGTAGTA